MKGYKGFNKGLVCLNKQYAENTIFEEDEAVICESGMHFCKNPWDVLEYYPFIDDDGELNEFAEVESLADCNTNDDKKYCTTKLKIKNKISFDDFVKILADELDATSGDYSQIATSRDWAKIATSEDYSKIAISGYHSKIATSGYMANIATSRDFSQIATSGDYSKIATSGDYAEIVTSGCHTKINSIGKHSVIYSIGECSLVKAKKGSWITLAEHDEVGEIKCIKAEYVDGKKIKEDTYYKLVKGEFVEW